jgi:hypothetical protein
VSGIGGYVRRKDRRHEPYGLHWTPGPVLGRLHHIVMPSGMVMAWRDEFPLPQTALSSLRFESFPAESRTDG